MVDYVESIKRPFSDLNKLVLSIALSVVPVLNFIFLGYLLDVIKGTAKKDMKMPEFANFGKMFVEGLLTLVIGFIYMLPVILLVIVMEKMDLFSAKTMLTGGVMGMAAQGPLAAFGMLQQMGIYTLVIAIVAAIFCLLGSVAVLIYANSRKFGTAFEFSKIAKTAFTGHYFWNWLLTILIAGALGALFGSVPGIGPVIAIAIVSTIAFTNLAQAYNEA